MTTGYTRGSFVSEELENAGNVGRAGRRKNGRAAWQRIVGYLRDRSTAPLDPGIWYSTVREGGCRFYDRVNEGRGKGVQKPAEF